MRRLIRSFAIAPLACLLLIGCSGELAPAPSNHQTNFENDTVYSFVCSMWVDDNMDGIPSSSEFANVGKNEFKRGDDITFVLSTKGFSSGARIRFALFPPGWTTSGLRKNTTSSAGHDIVRHNYNVSEELLDSYGPGIYRVQWYIYEEYVAGSSFMVTG